MEYSGSIARQGILRLHNKNTIHKRIINKLDFINIKYVCPMKDHFKSTNEKVINWGDVFANHTLNKGIARRIYIQ